MERNRRLRVNRALLRPSNHRTNVEYNTAYEGNAVSCTYVSYNSISGSRCVPLVARWPTTNETTPKGLCMQQTLQRKLYLQILMPLFNWTNQSYDNTYGFYESRSEPRLCLCLWNPGITEGYIILAYAYQCYVSTA